MKKSTWQDVDKAVETAVKSGDIHFKTFDNTPKAEIRAISYDGIHRDSPRKFLDWKNYSHKLLDRFNDVLNDIEIPNWDNLSFRNEDDFKSGSFGLFPSIWLIMINSLPNQQYKFIAYNHITRGISIIDNQRDISMKDSLKYSRGKQKFSICTKKVPNIQNLKMYEQMNMKGKIYQMEISGTYRERFGFYPVMVKKQEGSLVTKPFYQPNSEFLLENPEVITDQIIKWIRSGAMELVGPCNMVKSLVRTSMVLVYNENSDKYRTCFDGGLLKLTEDYSVPCHLDTVTDALLFLEKDDYMSKFDDSSGFLQAYLDPQSSDLTHVRWGNYIFRYYGAAFGIPRIPGDFQLLNSCAVSFLREHRVPISLYLDDRLVIEKNLTAQELIEINNGTRAPKNAFLTTMLIIASGGFISRKKSTFTCSKIIEFLGFKIDTENETLSIPKKKWDKFQLELNEVIVSDTVPFKQLEKLRGKMCSFSIIVTNLRLYIRRVTEYLTIAEKFNYPVIEVDDRLREDLKFWTSHNLKHIRTVRPWIEPQAVLLDSKIYRIWTDASDIAAGYVDHTGHERTIYFNEIEMALGIVMKEALAILRYLEFNASKMKNKRILFYCDNEGVVSSFYAGSKNSTLNDILRSINLLAIENNMVLAIFWVSTEIQKADKASRTVDLKEEILSDKAFNYVSELLVPTIDCMATSANTKCIKYYSRFHEDMAISKIS